MSTIDTVHLAGDPDSFTGGGGREINYGITISTGATMKKRGRPCLACRDARRAELDAALATGENNCAVARRFPPLSRDTIRVHRGHLGAALERHRDVVEAILVAKVVGPALDKIVVLEGAVEARRVRLAGTDDDRGFLAAVQTEAGLAKLRHELTPTPSAGNALSAGRILDDDELAARLGEVLESRAKGGGQSPPDTEPTDGG